MYSINIYLVGSFCSILSLLSDHVGYYIKLRFTHLKIIYEANTYRVNSPTLSKSPHSWAPAEVIVMWGASSKQGSCITRKNPSPHRQKSPYNEKRGPRTAWSKMFLIRK